jgi:signal transduction histidine kinase
MVPDTSKDPNFYSVVDMQSGFRTRDMLDVPLRSKDRIIGVLSAMNKKAGAFDQTDMELLNMVAGTVALYIENARFSEELRHAYNEVTSLNRAKDKVINHLSHELKTPLAILSASLNSMTKRLASLPEDSWRPSVERAKRSLDRILQMQYQVEDIMQEKGYRAHWMLTTLLDECADELEALVADVVGEGPVVEKIRSRIEEAFGPRVSLLEDILLHQFVPATIDEIRPLFSHRELTLTTQFEPAPAVRIPSDALKKVVVGLIKNAVENTPDEGEIEITVRKRGSGAELVVHDYGVGIAEENQQRIFEGFFTTQDTMDYSSKRPFDFNAGGKGADLLRMKIFSERYDFKIDMTSARCPHIPRDKDLCPGRISQCPHCKEREDCHRSGGTTFRIFFPSAMENGGEGRQALPESNSKG